MEAVREKVEGQPQQHRRGNLLLTRNFSLWSEVAQRKVPGRSGRTSSWEPVAKKGKQLLTKRGMKSGFVGLHKFERRPVHQMGMLGVEEKSEEAHRSRFGTGERLLATLGIKDEWSESVPIEGDRYRRWERG